MKQVAGLAKSAGTRMIAVALARLQSLRSGVVMTEQIRTRAVNIASSALSGARSGATSARSWRKSARSSVTSVTGGEQAEQATGRALVGSCEPLPGAGRNRRGGLTRLAGEWVDGGQFGAPHRSTTGRVLLVPFRARATHVVALRPVGIEQVLNQRPQDFREVVEATRGHSLGAKARCDPGCHGTLP